MDWKTLATLKNAYEREKELREFQEQLKENPIQITQARHLVNNTNVDLKQKTLLMKAVDELHKEGLVINDIPIEFNDYKKLKQQEGKYAVRKQVWERMSEQSRTKYLEHSAPAIYNDSHLDRLNDKQIESNLDKVLMDLEVNKDNYKPFYPPKKDNEN